MSVFGTECEVILGKVKLWYLQTSRYKWSLAHQGAAAVVLKVEKASNFRFCWIVGYSLGNFTFFSGYQSGQDLQALLPPCHILFSIFFFTLLATFFVLLIRNLWSPPVLQNYAASKMLLFSRHIFHPDLLTF